MGDQYIRKLTDKNLKRWKTDFPFVIKHPELDNQAYCSLCKQTLTPKRNVIEHHSTTKTHLVLSKCLQNPGTEKVEIITTISKQPAKVIELGGAANNANTVSLFPATEENTEYVLESYETLENADGNGTTHLLPAGTVLAELHNVEIEGGQSMAKISANSQFPMFIQQEIEKRFFTMEGYDALWKCDGGVFKMHKFVMSLFSPYIKNLLETWPDEEECMIYTPDLSLLTVKAFLCLCYTGRVILPSEEITESVIRSFNEMGFHGEFVMEKQKIKIVKDQEIVERIRGKRKRPEKRKRRGGRGEGKGGGEGKAVKQKTKKTKPTVVENEAEIDEHFIGNENEIFTDVVETGGNETEEFQFTTVLDDIEESGDEWMPGKNEAEDSSDEDLDTKNKKLDESKIKVEMEESQDNMMNASHMMLAQRDDEDKENRFDPLGDVEQPVDKKKQKQERHRDSANRYFLIGSYNNFHKGKLSSELKDDLLDLGDNDSGEDNLGSLYVCHLCYQVFPFSDAFNLHMEENHTNKRPRYGRFWVSENTYNCPTCTKDISVIHVVWFIKHMKYCGVDDEKAASLLKPGDLDQPIITKEEPKDPYAEDCMSGRETDKRFTNLCDLLLGRLNDSIWGCRTCYEAFSNKSELIQHYTLAHGGKMEYGPCYDAESNLYTCSYCNLVLKKSHLVLFIRHMKQCLVDPSLGAIRNHEEEGVEEDESADTIDPWGVVNRPLRVANLRSEWICEALFGRFIPILFPCHICYSVFQDEREIKQHFSENHLNIENCVENGSLYNKDLDCYNCPVCKKDVCKNQKSSIYFTYHMKKCAGETCTVTRTCDKCMKTFNKYNTYTNHQLYFCSENENNGFICHICSTVIKTKRELDTHVKYVHSTVRQYECEQCQKRFKRKGDLVVHLQSHTATPGFFCEQCGKSFFKKRNLKSHLSTHDTSDASKKHECIECGRRFLRLQALKNHLTTHSNERLYACEVCGARVKTQGTLMTHRKKVHKLNTAPPPSARIPSNLQQLPQHLQQHQLIHQEIGMATVTVAAAATHTVVATMPALGHTGHEAIIAHQKVASLLEASEIQHATTNEGAQILLIKTEKMPNEEDNMPHLM